MRWLYAIPLALLSTLLLFALIATIVGGTTPQMRPNEPLSFNLVMQESQSETITKARLLPEPPKPPSAPAPIQPNLELSTSQHTNFVAPELDVADIAIDTSIQGIELSAPTIAQSMPSNHQAIPLNRVRPQYPIRALKRNIEGYVILAFTIDSRGRPIDITIVEAKPNNVFEREALKALRHWKYQPKLVDGIAVEQPNQRVTIEFRLEQHES